MSSCVMNSKVDYCCVWPNLFTTKWCCSRAQISVALVGLFCTGGGRGLQGCVMQAPKGMRLQLYV